MTTVNELPAKWREMAKKEEVLAQEREEDGCSVWSSGHSGKQAAYLSCADELEMVMKADKE